MMPLGALAGFARGDLPFLQKLEELTDKVRDGEMTAAEYTAEWKRVSPTFGEVSDRAAALAVNMSMAAEYLEAVGKRIGDTERQVSALGSAMTDTRGEALAYAREQAMALKGFADSRDILASLSGEDARQRGLSDFDARVEKAMAARKKQAEEEAEARGIILSLTKEQYRADAEATVRAEDRADAEKKIVDLRESLNVTGLTLVDRDAVDTVNDLITQFETGQVPVETMQSRLEEISKLRLSDTIDGLIEKIIAAIPQLATLLGIAQSFPGVTPQWQTRGRGAVGRARRNLAVRQGIGADTAAEALRVARLSERDAAIEQSAQKLVDDASKAGGVLSLADAKRTATEIYDLEAATRKAGEASDDAAEAAQKYADGLADMESELALIPMGEFVKSVYDQAESLGLSRSELDAFIASAQSGGLDAAPQKFRDIAGAMREINAANIMRDLTAERELLFKGDAERNVYETLKDSGIALESVQGQVIANQIRMNHALGEARDIAVEFGQTFRTSFAQAMADADAAHEESRLQHINELLQEAGATGEEVSLAQRKAILEMADAMADAEHGATFMERAWKAAWKAIVDATTNAMETIASKLMEAGINGLFDNLLGTGSGGGNNLFGTIIQGVLGGITGGIGGGATGGVMGNGLWGSAIFNAKGNVFSGPGISAFSNSIVTQPTVFPFAKGIGMMGEAGWEAIMPLRRGPDGRLGVAVANQNVPAAANRNGDKIEINISGSRQDAAAIARATEALVHRVITQRQMDPYRR